MSKKKQSKSTVNKQPAKKLSTPTYVVGIGASAGGLEAIQQFFDNMPSNEDIAFVVIQHLSPDFKSLMDQLLARNTQMRIDVVEDGMPLEANTVFLIPPKNNITMSHGRFKLTEQLRGHTLNLPVDIFFDSLAVEYGTAAIAIVLSGTGSDGSKGIVEVAKHGGLTIVQSPDNAKFDGMPRNAIATQTVQCVVPLHEMTNIIKEYIDDPDNFEHKINQRVVLPGEGYAKLFNMLLIKYKVNFNDYKPTTISRRVDRRVKTLALASLKQYIDYLQEHEDELETLHRDLLIGVTSFFRDQDAFKDIKEKVVPALVKQYSETHEALRIWVAACSTGQEVYSILMLLLDYAEKHNQPIEAKVFATDISKEFLDEASQGIYDEETVSAMPEGFLERFFKKTGNHYQIRPELRNMVVFSPHNLITDPPFTKMDYISCRNFLIYVQPMVQHKILSFFKYTLNTPGFLFLGSSESLGDEGDEFEPINATWKIFKKIKHVRFPLQASALQLPIQQPLAIPQRQAGGYERYAPSLSLAMYHEALSYLVPCGFLVDSDKHIIHIFGEGTAYINLKAGSLQQIDVVSSIAPELKAPLSTAFHKAKASKEPYSYTGLEVNQSGEKKQIRLTVQPLHNTTGNPNYYLIGLYESDEVVPVGNTMIYKPDEQSQQVFNALERELQETRESLQATIEEVETTNEELQSTNEELLASNEELQSTNEELHSVNEELYTVNAEYQKKIEELTLASTDIDNILRSTNVGAIFVDKDLKLRFFTPSIAPIYSLVDSDIGRSLKNFTHVLKHRSIIKDTESVLRTEVDYRKEVCSENGQWYALKIMPYLTEKSEAGGAIITLVDVTESKEANEKLREADERLNLALQSSNIGIWSREFDEDIIEIDDTTAVIFGLNSKQEVTNYQQFTSCIHPEDRKRVEAAVKLSLDRGDDYFADFRVIRPDKTVHFIAARGRVHQDVITGARYMTGVCWDVTDRIRLEDQTVEFEGRKVAMDDITDGWWDWNLETNEQYMSPKFKAMFGYQDHELANLRDTWENIIFPADLKISQFNYEKHIKTEGKHLYFLEARFKHKNGQTIWVICRGRAIKDKNGKYTHMIGTHTDITEQKKSEEKLNQLALHDSLTGLPNRNSFMDYLPRAIERAKRNKALAALFYIDLDNFKQVNDSLGHKVGDDLLISVADRLIKSGRTIDFIARLGGDEFAIILEDIESTDEIGKVAQRCVEALSRPITIDGHEINTSLSLGIAVYPHGGETPDDILQHADVAMYRAKDTGKNDFAFFNEKINEQVQRHHLLETEMHKAIENKEFSVVYQPQFSSDGKEIVGVEALLRWPNEKLGYPSPGEFIPIAESSKAIHELGEWVLSKTVDDYQSLFSVMKGRELTLSVNVSAVQLSHSEFANTVHKLLSKHQRIADILVLEITETSLMRHIEQVRKTLNSLSDKGVQFALDDFGIGYSSMEYLKHLPISYLKIDQSFVRDIGKDENDMAIIRAIISLGQGLNIKTIAEGVEEKEQLQYLKQHHCDQIQGYYFAKPMPLDEVIEYIESHYG